MCYFKTVTGVWKTENENTFQNMSLEWMMWLFIVHAVRLTIGDVWKVECNDSHCISYFHHRQQNTYVSDPAVNAMHTWPPFLFR